ncbi:MAG: hypothetical protein EOO41_03380, partial [Methanobacteriota archaeon]
MSEAGPSTRAELYAGPGPEGLPADLQTAGRDVTACAVCGVSYLIYSEVQSLSRQLAAAKAELAVWQERDARRKSERHEADAAEEDIIQLHCRIADLSEEVAAALAAQGQAVQEALDSAAADHKAVLDKVKASAAQEVRAATERTSAAQARVHDLHAGLVAQQQRAREIKRDVLDVRRCVGVHIASAHEKLVEWTNTTLGSGLAAVAQQHAAQRASLKQALVTAQEATERHAADAAAARLSAAEEQRLAHSLEEAQRAQVAQLQSMQEEQRLSHARAEAELAHAREVHSLQTSKLEAQVAELSAQLAAALRELDASKRDASALAENAARTASTAAAELETRITTVKAQALSDMAQLRVEMETALATAKS